MAPGGNGQEKKRSIEPRYIFVRDLAFEHRGWAFSTEQQAIDGLQGTWARSALSDYCGSSWAGGDGYRGVVDVDGISLEQISSSRWVGSARLNGYCRLNSTDADYDKVPACPTQSRGQPNCYVDQRYYRPRRARLIAPRRGQIAIRG